MKAKEIFAKESAKKLAAKPKPVPQRLSIVQRMSINDEDLTNPAPGVVTDQRKLSLVSQKINEDQLSLLEKNPELI